MARHLSVVAVHLRLALLRGNGKKGRGFLFNFLALTLRAGDVALFVFLQGHRNSERLLAFFANKLIARHTGRSS